MRAGARSDERLEANDATMFSYLVGILRDYLEADSEVSE
jgi:hypothetical protein